MSIHIEDLTVRFKNSVTAIDHADLDIPNGIFGLVFGVYGRSGRCSESRM